MGWLDSGRSGGTSSFPPSCLLVGGSSPQNSITLGCFNLTVSLVAMADDSATSYRRIAGLRLGFLTASSLGGQAFQRHCQGRQLARAQGRKKRPRDIFLKGMPGKEIASFTEAKKGEPRPLPYKGDPRSRRGRDWSSKATEQVSGRDGKGPRPPNPV